MGEPSSTRQLHTRWFSSLHLIYSSHMLILHLGTQHGLDNLFFPIFREPDLEALKFLILFPRHMPTQILVICKIAREKQITWKLTETWANKS